MSTHIKTAQRYIRRSPFQAMAAIFVLALTFFVGTFLAMLVYSSNNLLHYFETRPQVIAFLKDGVNPEQISELQNRLNNDARIKEVRYVPKEEALSLYKEATSDNPLLAELVSPSIFPASLEFSIKDLSFAQGVIDEVKEEEMVDEVGFTASIGGEKSLGDVVTRLRTLTNYVRIGGGVFVAILSLTSFLVLIVIISMRISARKGEVEILKLIGATPGFIKSPIVIEALIYAALGVVGGWLLAFLIWLYSAPSLAAYFGEIPILPRDMVDFFTLFLAILGGELVAGLLLAMIGSSLAISRANRAK